MTYIGRFESQAGAEHTIRKLKAAKDQMAHSFRDDERRQIPQVQAVFEKIDDAIATAESLAKIFDGSGSHTVSDFIPDDTGLSVNDREMDERRTRPWFA
jgi:hypothetical protein